MTFDINDAEAIKKDYVEIAEGSARTIYEIDPTTVAKVAKPNSNGIQQNFAEFRIYNQCKKYGNMKDKQIIEDLYGCCDDIDEEKKADCAKQFINIIAEVKGISDNGEVLIMEKMPQEFNKAIDDDMDNPTIRLFIDCFNLHKEDIKHRDNWMVNDDSEKLVDYGCTTDIWENHTEKEEDYNSNEE